MNKLSLSHNVTVLTANERLSAYLRKHYDQTQLSLGLSTWPSLDCLPLNTWLQRTVATLTNNRLILSETQELALWEKIITVDLNQHETFLLLRPFATAQIANKAWHLLKQWQLPLTALKHTLSEDVEHFYRWAKAFKNICHDNGWMGHSDCAEVLIQALDQRALSLPQHLILSGFEEVSPQITQLCHALSDFTQVHWLQPGISLSHLLSTIPTNAVIDPQTPTTPSPYNIALLDIQRELHAMALWAKQRLEHNPEITLGCVVPELNTLRPQVERIFTTVFLDGSKTPALNPLPFNLSAGTPLVKYPLIDSALRIVQLAQPQLSLENISHLLRSAFIGGAEQEQAARFILDIALRQLGERYLTLNNLLSFSKQQANCPTWIALLTNYTTLVQNPTSTPHQTVDITAQYLPSVWVYYFIQLLEALGWPGERALNSTEFQQLQRWQTLLSEYTSLDLVVDQPISFASACDHLQRLAQRTLFQPQTADVPIQILGLLEATGMEFDQLWIMGMNDEYWPRSADPNPFIPVQLQRKYNMPHASAERELIFSQKLTQRFIKSASQVIFSYSLRAGDTLLAPSALISAWPNVTLNELITELPTLPSYDSGMEYIVDEQAPPVTTKGALQGGASILQYQAACPFRALAKIRLNATQLPDLISGLSLIERGILLHEILEQLWKNLDNQDTLKRYEEGNLHVLVQATVANSLARKLKQRPLSLKKPFIAVETERLTQLIMEWLQLEKARPFFRVTQCEATHKVDFAGLEMSFRLDREDELGDGSKLIIDYKTGDPHIKSWFGDRPDEPQLPLYSLTSSAAIQGLIFAKIRRGDSQFHGISATETDIAGVKPIAQLSAEYRMENWQAFQMQQRKILTQLAQDFLCGKAAVDPKKEETCRHCELQMLCRVYETAG